MTKKTNEKELRFAVLATDIVCFRIVKEKLNVLIGQATVSPYLGFIGGLIAPKEDAQEAVGRHLNDKAGISKVYKEQLFTFSKVDRDPRGRVVSVAYLAVTHKDPRNEKKAKIKTSWYPVEEVPELAYDHNEILKVAVDRLRSKVKYTNIVRYFLPRKFTLTELQAVYEIILEKKIDKRNFRKKVLKMEMIKKSGEVLRGRATRPAELFEFVGRGVRIYEIL